MRIALINNGTKEPERIQGLLSQNNIDVFSYERADEVDTSQYNLVVLSGSSLFPIAYNLEKLEKELSLIRRARVPLLGICYGCELISVAFGGTLKEVQEPKRDAVSIEVLADDPIFNGRKEFKAYDAHRWIIDKVPDELMVLAQSAHGPEVVRHRDLAMYGFQFHPEKMLDDTYGDELFNAFLREHVV